MEYDNRVRASAIASVMAGVMLLAGCGSATTESINLAGYAPVIDVKGQGYDQATYLVDLQECRDLGMRVQATYAEQRKREQEDQRTRAFAGALIGAVAGHAIGDHNDYHTGRLTTAGALTGASIGASTGAVDYTRTLAKFGPTAIVDRCMTDRGYKVLSAEGFGGG